MIVKYKLITIGFCLFFLKSFSQSCTDVEEWMRKRHTISNMTYGHPYTTFDRHNGLSLFTTILHIRKKIIEEKPNDNVYKAYQAIYTNATSSMPSDNGMSNNAVSELALWAKDNAFVFLIELDGNGKINKFTTL